MRLLASEGNEIGPGHAGLYSEGAATWLSYHYYDGADHGRPKLGIRRLTWSADGWPALAPRDGSSPSAPGGLPSR